MDSRTRSACYIAILSRVAVVDREEKACLLYSLKGRSLVDKIAAFAGVDREEESASS